MKVVLRVVLTVLVVVLGLVVGIKLTPGLASWTGLGRRATAPELQSALAGGTQPDWGGGRVTFSNRSAAGSIDSARTASPGDKSSQQTFSGSAGGVLLRQKSDSDYALTLALRSRGQEKTTLFEVPSSGRFRKEMLPGEADAEPPAADIPLYPQSSCRMQVGRGTATFIGFYLTPDSVEAVRSFYIRALTRLGWQHLAAGGPGFVETFTKRKDDRSVVVQLRRQDSVTTRIGLVATTSGGPTPSERK
ncbi:hypothetical protein FJY68_00790 [candidate division WOR-3 bacterium]|uniref:Uncharacterized protein n=1 Tax=candidate division WOR-3 bacterium TaxID=2052148 RepID=A0A937XCA9_UNCW3|nr:hypothetical protein [candidate division WOR-3 bacterium]